MSMILAVSGGVDSVVMLHLLRHHTNVHVAHFDHGTRPSSRDDQKFVAALAQKYKLPYHFYRGNLGENASEEAARQARYKFFMQLAQKYDGKICTAHHLEDLVETVAINCARGTGWRGLAVFGAPQIERPFLNPDMLEDTPWDKQKIWRYAAEHQLTFRQDPTNNENNYLRNRLRPLVAALPIETKLKIYHLWQQQRQLGAQIERETLDLLTTFAEQRDFYRAVSDEVALACLYTLLGQHHISVTRPQLQDFLAAIRTYQTGKYFNLPSDRLVRIRRHTFQI